MRTFFQAVLPEDCNIKNFTSDWNNGINLSALIDYCKPGLMPNWRSLNPNNGPDNCKKAMEVAEKHFKIPCVLEPEYLSSPHLDELSGMTYSILVPYRVTHKCGTSLFLSYGLNRQEFGKIVKISSKDTYISFKKF